MILGDDPNAPKIVQFGKNLQVDELEEWILETKNRIKIFAYAYQDMLKLDTNIVVHHLTLRLDVKLFNQKPHCMHLGKALLVKVKLQKMLDTNFIEAIAYLEWFQIQ